VISGFLKHALRASVGDVAGQAEVQVFSLDIATVLLEHGLGVYSPWPKQYVYVCLFCLPSRFPSYNEIDIATVLLEHGLGVYSPWPKQYVYSRVPSSAITIVPLSCHQELSYSEL